MSLKYVSYQQMFKNMTSIEGHAHHMRKEKREKNFLQIIRGNKCQLKMIFADSKTLCYLQPIEVSMFIVLMRM